MTVDVNNQTHIIHPERSVDIFFTGEKLRFYVQSSALQEMMDALDEIDDQDASVSLKDRILTKLTKKAFKKLPDTVLNTAVGYEVSCTDSQNVVINLSDGAWSVCDGKVADFLDILPIAYLFPRAETENGTITVTDVKATNRKEYLRLVRKLLLFMHTGLTSLHLLFFLPEYLVIFFLSSDFYTKHLIGQLYKLRAAERESKLQKKERTYEQKEKTKGCLPTVLVIAVILGGILWWGMTSEPDVIIAEDFSTVVCFEETFVRIDGGLPSDAKDVFLEDYVACYPLPDGGYDMDNYYCYIYETPDGTRYMWLKDNCSDKASDKKEYADYQNPLVYQSTGQSD